MTLLRELRQVQAL